MKIKGKVVLVGRGEEIVQYTEEWGSLIVEYYLDGKLHRKDGPAKIEYYNRDHSKVQREYWYEIRDALLDLNDKEGIQDEMVAQQILATVCLLLHRKLKLMRKIEEYNKKMANEHNSWVKFDHHSNEFRDNIDHIIEMASKNKWRNGDWE